MGAEVKVPLRDFQLFQLGILKEFIKLCEANGLQYWAAYGTLLGAARHKGFIPWDDDIDVWMPAADYLAFRDIARSQLPDDYYVQSHALNACNFIGWQRIGLKNTTSLDVTYADVHAEWGICIDVFPLTGRPEDADSASLAKFQKTATALKRTAWKYEYLHEAKTQSGVGKLVNRLKAMRSDAQSSAAFAGYERALFADMDNEQSTYYADIFDPNAQSLRREWFAQSVDLPFEDTTLRAPADYALVLDELYGSDWPEMPPAEKRVCHSGGGSDTVIVSLTEPYTQFLK